MPPKKATKKQSASKSTDSKTTTRSSAKKSNSRRKKDESESEEEFRLSDVSEQNSDMEEEIDIKKKLGSKYDDDGSDFEPLEPWDDIEKEEKSKNKRVKKSPADNKKGSGGGSASKSQPKARVGAKPKETAPKAGAGGAQKGNRKAKAVAGNLRVRLDATEQENEGDGEFFATDEHPQFNESSAFIPDFIQEPHVRDKEGRYSNDHDYDPTTLYVPPEDMKKTGPLLRQYWEMKANHFDKLVGIKVWKFYYFYFNDAIIVHRIIDMKMTMTTNSTYTFFHESCMARFAPKLLAAGYKIVIIEQMEEIKQNKDDDVIKRDICQILTRGTAVENQDLDYSSRFFLAIFEEDLNFGVAFVDTTTHEFYIGEFKDDSHRSNLRTLITRTKPVEVVHMRGYLENETLKMLRSLSVKPSYSVLSFNEPRHFADIFNQFGTYFTKKDDDDEEEVRLPELINSMKDTIDLEMKGAKKLEGTRLMDFERKVPFFYTMQALAIANTFLENVLLAETVVSMGNYQPFDVNLEKKGSLYLDSQALLNLEVLDVQYLNMFSESHSLFGYMDKTVSAFGKRMLKRWLTSPFLDAEKIKERQDAVEDLMRNEQFMQVYQDKLSKFADLERLINRIYNLGNRKRMSAIYYEDFAKNRLKEFLAFLGDLRKVEELITEINPYTLGFKSKRVLELSCFKDVDIKAFEKRKKVVATKKGAKGKKGGKGKKSAENEDAIEEEEEATTNYNDTEGIFPRINNIISDLEGMVTLVDGLPIPAPGVNKESDAIIAQINGIKTALNKYLEQQRKALKCDDIRYVHSKHRYELEVPEHAVEGSKRPKDFAVTSKRKGYLRFHTSEIESHLRPLWRIEAEFQKVLVPFICDYFRKFYERNAYWQQIIDCLGELDCLCSLAKLALTLPTRCKPEVLPMSSEPVFDLQGMVHPMAAKTNPNFVPNDIVVDEGVDIFLITGPNMGGKSTLLRQTCLAVIMAQVGSFVPAESFTLTAVDRIFTRVGASDRIFEGKSTFFIEMEETYSIMTEATKNSLLIIDELGRGTSTYDGVAIAYATLKYIAERIGAITLFATHYHLLLEEFRLYKNIETYFMQCEVREGSDDIKFLYKFGRGQAVKSHGIIIAKVAGLPDHVIAQAKEKAAFMTNEKRNIGFEKNLMEKFNKIIDEMSAFADHDLGDAEVAKKGAKKGAKGKGKKAIGNGSKDLDIDKIFIELSQLH